MNWTRLGAEQSGITGVATAHHFVGKANHTGRQKFPFPNSRTKIASKMIF